MYPPARGDYSNKGTRRATNGRTTLGNVTHGAAPSTWVWEYMGLSKAPFIAHSLEKTQVIRRQKGWHPFVCHADHNWPWSMTTICCATFRSIRSSLLLMSDAFMVSPTRGGGHCFTTTTFHQDWGRIFSIALPVDHQVGSTQTDPTVTVNVSRTLNLNSFLHYCWCDKPSQAVLLLWTVTDEIANHMLRG